MSIFTSLDYELLESLAVETNDGIDEMNKRWERFTTNYASNDRIIADDFDALAVYWNAIF